MFGFLKRKRKSLIGLDIGSNVVKVLRLDLGGDRPVVTHFGMADLPPEAIVDGEIMDRELVIEAIREAAGNAGVPAEPVASAVSGRAVIVKKIVMDKMSEEDAREAIYWEAEQHVPFDIDDITLDFQILQPDIGAGQMELLLVAAKKEMIQNWAELIRDAGFQPAIIDVASFANQNAWEYACGGGGLPAVADEPVAEDKAADGAVDDLEPFAEAGDDAEAAPEAAPSEFVALLDVGGGVTNVHIVKSGVPYFTRDLPIGTAHFIEEFQKQLGLTYETAAQVARGHVEGADPQLVADIVRSVGSEIYQGLEPSLSYLKTSGEAEGIDRIVLSGGGAHLPGLREYLADSYGVPSEVSDPLAGLDYAPGTFGESDPHELSPLLTVTVGLALREAVQA
ncbi:MAG TPA: type IV pilus assembly protein PilM [Candidatus Krumholzibacteria bacterium]|nr:type IV pilus assembly protein PilM [Candidatus Krumholzibacteria bacterium]